MKKVVLPICLLLGLVGASNALSASPTTEKATVSAQCITQSQIDLGKAMRSLWEDHVIYTKYYIISALADLPDLDAVTKRLLRNQDDIGNSIKPYYGNKAGAKLTALLREHILIAAEVVKAAKTNDGEGLKSSQKKWQDNAVEIATFLSSANPNWSKETLQKMLFMHLDLTTGEVVARLNKNWKKDINSFDQGEAHMLDFADFLSDGIIKQFPNKFIH